MVDIINWIANRIISGLGGDKDISEEFVMEEIGNHIVQEKILVLVKQRLRRKKIKITN